jgi:hypothetical protein
MEQQQKRRPLGITIIAILTIIDGMFSVDINNGNVPPATGTSTLGCVTIPETLLVGMSHMSC